MLRTLSALPRVGRRSRLPSGDARTRSAARRGRLSRTRAIGAVLCLSLSLMFPSVGGARKAARLAPDFTLVDQHAHPFRLAKQRGRPVVLFFGYTHCPDVCPTILASLRRAREVIGPRGHDILVVFISVDPGRDDVDAMRAFVNVSGNWFVGLTGSDAQLAPVYRAYRVQHTLQPDGARQYLVSHSAFVYYIGRDGRLRGYGAWDDSPEILEEALRELI